MIKAIETHYKSCKFRSRTEARWAVFFDTIGISWEYEVEGFQLNEVTRYLPDFRIKLIYPEATYFAWVEIKGENPSSKEIMKLHKLAKQTGKLTFMFVGMPGDHKIYLCNQHNKLSDCMERVAERNESFERLLGFYRRPDDFFMMVNPDRHVLLQAIRAAKSARFEFGETP